MNLLATVLLASLAGLFGITYLGVVRLGDINTDSVAYRTFRIAFLPSATSVLLGVALFLSVMGRFEPIVVVGAPIELAMIRIVGSVLVTLGLVVCMGVLAWVGIGTDLAASSLGVE